jgi:carbon monoxide dehydrogenase subunit G
VAFIHKELIIDAPPDVVWDALRDVGAVHTRLARGFVVNTQPDGEFRVVTFANGVEVRERIVDVDDAARRVAYSASGAQLTHHHATFQVFAVGDRRSRLVWLADLLPAEARDFVDGMMEQGCVAIRQTLEAA